MSPKELDERDLTNLGRAIDISRHALESEGHTPFGALVVIDGHVVGEGASSVVLLQDPTAHAEVMALRAAGQKLGTHLMPDAVMYCSSEPCPMCLTACYWARIRRVVYAADSRDVAEHGFADLELYRELSLPTDHRSIIAVQVDGPIRAQAVAVLHAWARGAA